MIKNIISALLLLALSVGSLRAQCVYGDYIESHPPGSESNSVQVPAPERSEAVTDTYVGTMVKFVNGRLPNNPESYAEILIIDTEYNDSWLARLSGKEEVDYALFLTNDYEKKRITGNNEVIVGSGMQAGGLIRFHYIVKLVKVCNSETSREGYQVSKYLRTREGERLVAQGTLWKMEEGQEDVVVNGSDTEATQYQATQE
jgi:hypothetical protein